MMQQITVIAISNGIYFWLYIYGFGVKRHQMVKILCSFTLYGIFYF